MRRYAPDLQYSEDRCWGDWVTTANAVMVESMSGEWVKRQTAVDVSRMYQARIARLEKALQKTHKQLTTLKIETYLKQCGDHVRIEDVHREEE